MTSPEYDVPASVRVPPAPGEESAGPALTDLVRETRRAATALEALYRQARYEAGERLYPVMVPFATDGNGDAAIKVFEVPQGATGYLMQLALDQAGVTPAAPNTSASLWHAIYAGPQGTLTQAQVRAVGALLDCSPLTPAADAQIPYVYTYGDRYGAPALVGPGVFWFVVDAATASVQHAIRANLLVVQPEP